jgi:hypothetical protein
VVRGLSVQSSGAYFLLGAEGMEKRDSQGLVFFAADMSFRLRISEWQQ